MNNERSLPSLLSPFRVLSELINSRVISCLYFNSSIQASSLLHLLRLASRRVLAQNDGFYYSSGNKNVIYISEKKNDQIYRHSLVICQTFAPSFANIYTLLFQYILEKHLFTRPFQTGQSIQKLNSNKSLRTNMLPTFISDPGLTLFGRGKSRFDIKRTTRAIFSSHKWWLP